MNLTKFFNQTAVYWGSPVPNGWGGFTYADPVEVAVRWTDTQERFATAGGAPGNTVSEILSRSVILAETDFDVKGRMYLGALIDLDSGQEPDYVDALTIESFSKIPDKTASQYLRKAWLV